MPHRKKPRGRSTFDLGHMGYWVRAHVPSYPDCAPEAGEHASIRRERCSFLECLLPFYPQYLLPIYPSTKYPLRDFRTYEIHFQVLKARRAPIRTRRKTEGRNYIQDTKKPAGKLVRLWWTAITLPLLKTVNRSKSTVPIPVCQSRL